MLALQAETALEAAAPARGPHRVLVRPNARTGDWFWICLTCRRERSSRDFTTSVLARAAAGSHAANVELLR